MKKLLDLNTVLNGLIKTTTSPKTKLVLIMFKDVLCILSNARNEHIKMISIKNQLETLKKKYSQCHKLVEQLKLRIKDLLGEEGDVPQREIAKQLKMSVGKVNGAIKRLSQHGLITNTNTCKLPTTYGRQTLHEIWPALFAEPAQAELTDDEKMPF